MNWMKPLLPLVAALAVPACSFPCDRSPEAFGPAQRVSGPGQLVVTCASTKETRAYPLTNTWRLSGQYDVDTDKRYIHVGLDFQGDKTPGELLFEFQNTVADGSYPITLQAETPVKTSLLWTQTLEGIFAFSRSREIPFLEDLSPETGTHTTQVDVTLELKGKMSTQNTFEFRCPEPLDYTLESTRLHLEKTTDVGTCDGGDVLDGLSNIKGGGH